MNQRMTLEFDTPPMTSSNKECQDFIDILAKDLAQQIYTEMVRLEQQDSIKHWQSYFKKWDFQEQLTAARINNGNESRVNIRKV